MTNKTPSPSHPPEPESPGPRGGQRLSGPAPLEPSLYAGGFTTWDAEDRKSI